MIFVKKTSFDKKAVLLYNLLTKIYNKKDTGTMDINVITDNLAKTKIAARKLAVTSTETRNKALDNMADAIVKSAEKIIKQNKIDVDSAVKNGLSSALIDRLTLTEQRIKSIADSIKEIARLPDPVGEIISDWTRPNGLHLQKIRVPLGVVCMIYESRPNITAETAALCVKSGNAVVLRGGSESINSNRVIADVIIDVLHDSGIPDGTVFFIPVTDRQVIYDLIKQDKYIDLVIPRGNEQMIRSIREGSTVPVLSHRQGLCHTYIDEHADVQMAQKIAYNAKVQRPGVCNATETLLVHKNIAKEVLPALADMYKKSGVELRGCTETMKLVPGIKLAADKDWDTEYLDKILSIKIVETIQDAIDHVNKHGSGHTESIVTEDKTAAARFINEVDTSAVFHNASTRLHDGGVFGFGSEIGISTQKLHARGTMGLRELTTTKYVVYGTGQIRE
jgi:glutamate-5-semialdehyde dehydrogenase